MTALLSALVGAAVTLRVKVFPLFTAICVLLRVIFVTGCLTVILHVAFTPLPSFAVAVMTADPLLIPLTTPVAVTVAILALPVFHVTALLSALVGAAVAFRVTVFPLFTAICVLLSVSFVTGCLTVILHVAFTPLPSFAVAVMTAVPLLIPLTSPALVTVATLVSELVQVTALFLAETGSASAFNVRVLSFMIEALVLLSIIFVTS